MKKLIYLPLLLLIVGFVMGQTCYSQDEIAATDEAERVLERYIYHLKNGNTSEILNLITGPLLKKRERLLRDNATMYGDFLWDRYKSANFLIIPGSFTHNNRLSLRASIIFDDKHKLDLIFSFAAERSNGSLKIYSEEEF